MKRKVIHILLSYVCMNVCTRQKSKSQSQKSLVKPQNWTSNDWKLKGNRRSRDARGLPTCILQHPRLCKNSAVYFFIRSQKIMWMDSNSISHLIVACSRICTRMVLVSSHCATTTIAIANTCFNSPCLQKPFQSCKVGLAATSGWQWRLLLRKKCLIVRQGTSRASTE